MRKLVHTTLMKLTENEDKLYQLMQTLDAHSAAVARKHYVLKDPEDDVVLAKALFPTMCPIAQFVILLCVACCIGACWCGVW